MGVQVVVLTVYLNILARSALCMVSRLLVEREVVLYCDLHGHSRKQNVFIYGCENRANKSKRLHERVFPAMLSKNCPDKVALGFPQHCNI